MSARVALPHCTLLYREQLCPSTLRPPCKPDPRALAGPSHSYTPSASAHPCRFIESNPQGKHHSQVEPAQLPAFLGEATEVLKNLSVGYGLWAYRAYRRNELDNGHFQQRLDGWTVEGCCAWPIDTDSENVALYLHASNGPAGIRQAVTLPEGKCDNAAGAARLCFKAMSLSGQASLAVVSGWNVLLHCHALMLQPGSTVTTA